MDGIFVNEEIGSDLKFLNNWPHSQLQIIISKRSKTYNSSCELFLISYFQICSRTLDV